MVKTQVYIPEQDNANLLETARLLGIHKSEAIRRAVHEYCQDKSRQCHEQLIKNTAGILNDTPLDAEALRRDSNEGFQS